MKKKRTALRFLELEAFLELESRGLAIVGGQEEGRSRMILMFLGLCGCRDYL